MIHVHRDRSISFFVLLFQRRTILGLIRGDVDNWEMDFERESHRRWVFTEEENNYRRVKL